LNFDGRFTSQPVSWQSVGLLAVVGGGILAYYKKMDEERKAIITGDDNKALRHPMFEYSLGSSNFPKL
jgi:hypothetical protein